MSTKTLGPLVLDIESIELQQDEAEILKHPQVGGVILFSRNFESSEQLQGLTRRLRELRANLLISVDHEGGRVQRFKNDFTRLPAMQTLGRLYDESGPTMGVNNTKEVGWLMAAELLAHGIDLSYAPVLDLDDCFSDVIGDRAFSADAERATILAEAFIDGMHEAGMASTGKHFPGHGGVKADSHLELPMDKRRLEELESRDLIPFERLSNKLDALMSAHVIFPSIDAELVSFSTFWLRDFLRKKMAYKGVVFSDDLTMEGAASGGSFAQRARSAMAAGCDALLVCNHRQGAIEVLEYLERENEPIERRCLSALAKRKHLQLDHVFGSDRWLKARDIIARLQG